MIGLDTNVLVRYLAQVEPKQVARARRLIEEELSVSEPVFISLVVLAKSCRVLKRLYSVSADELLATGGRLVEHAPVSAGPARGGGGDGSVHEG